MSYNRRYRGGNSRPKNNFKNQRSRAAYQATFNPTELIRQSANSRPQKEVIYQAENLFSDFNFSPILSSAIEDKGFTKPTPIQDQAIPHINKERDVIGLANTGTGKTAAFLLPLINMASQNPSKRVLIVAPTRELAVQIKNELQSFTRSINVHAALCIGGVPLDRQTKMLQRKPQFVIGTPGRIMDLEKRRKLILADFTNIVLDEVDRMLDMGFINDVTYIVDKLPQQKQALFFSATLPRKLESIVHKFMNNPVLIEVAQQEITNTVKQEVINIGNKSKVSVLHELLSKTEFEKVLVFGRTKHGINKLARVLNDQGVNTAIIHGNKSQNQRQKSLQLFRDDRVRVLLATDVASRGLDIDNVTHVINYDLPQTKEDYIHRIGRTGRANKNGVAVSFVN